MSENYEFIKNIGEGMYGKVYKAKNKKENKYYAIKRLNYKDITDKEKKQINNEVSLIKKLNHPNIISYKESFTDKDNYFCIVTTFCEGGDIYNKIQNQKIKNEFFNEEQILNWLVQILLGIDHIHKNNIIHRDIKPQNIFIQNKHIVCIGDFGIAKIMDQIQTQTITSIIGSPLYMSPESFNEPNSKVLASDIWSTGCCIFEMCNLKHAFGGDRIESVFIKVRDGKHPPVNKKYSLELRNIIDSMLNVNPKSRPTIPQLLKSNFLRPKVANFINDFIKNYKLYNGNEEQVLVLKGQAEQFGIFKNKIIKEIKESSVEKNRKNFRKNMRRESSNPISPERDDKIKKYSLDKNKKYKINDNKKVRNKNVLNEFPTNSNINKYNKHGNYISDDNKKKRNSKEDFSPNYFNNINRIKNSLSNNKKRASGRPLTSQKIGKNIQNDQEYNISVIKKKEKNIEIFENYNNNNSNQNNNSNENNDNIKFQNKIEFNNNSNEPNINSKEKLLGDRIKYFKKKCIESLQEEKFSKAYEYLYNIKKSNNKEINNRDIRKNLIKIIGEENIGYWHFIDQIIIFQEMLNDR